MRGAPRDVRAEAVGAGDGAGAAREEVAGSDWRTRGVPLMRSVLELPGTGKGRDFRDGFFFGGVIVECAGDAIGDWACR